MKYKVNQLVWYVDQHLEITRVLVIEAKLNRDALPAYTINKVEHTTYGDNGEPMSFVLADNWRRANTDEADLFANMRDAQDYVDECIMLTKDISGLVIVSVGPK